MANNLPIVYPYNHQDQLVRDSTEYPLGRGLSSAQCAGGVYIPFWSFNCISTHCREFGIEAPLLSPIIVPHQGCYDGWKEIFVCSQVMFCFVFALAFIWVMLGVSGASQVGGLVTRMVVTSFTSCVCVTPSIGESDGKFPE